MRRATLGMVGLVSALSAKTSEARLVSDAGDMMIGLQPKLLRLDPPGLTSSEEVNSSAGLATELGDDVMKTGGGMEY